MWKAAIIVTQYLVRGPGIENGQLCTMECDFLEFICEAMPRVFPPNSSEPLTKSLCHCFGLGFSRLLGQFFS